MARTISSLIYEVTCLKFVNCFFLQIQGRTFRARMGQPNQPGVTFQLVLHGPGVGLETSPAPCRPEVLGAAGSRGKLSHPIAS